MGVGGDQNSAKRRVSRYPETKKTPKNHDDDSGASCQHMAKSTVQGDNVGFKSNSTAKK